MANVAVAGSLLAASKDWVPPSALTNVARVAARTAVAHANGMRP
jgi:hypothetical protein